MHVRICLAFLLALGLFGCSATRPGGSARPHVRYIDPDPATGSSEAVVVGAAPLAHTTQLFPLDRDGRLVGAGDLGQQAERVLENLRLALAGVGADLDDVVKLHVYAAGTEAAEGFRTHLARTFTGAAKPAVSFVTGRMRHPEALVALDAVALAAAPHGGLRIYRVPTLYGPADQGHVAVVPSDGLVYISGQVAQGDDLTAAMRETLEASHARMAYLGLSNEDVVQVKVFLEDLTVIDTLEQQIAAYYRKKPAPPIVFVEWVHPGSDIEVELIAAKPPAGRAEGDAVTYTTPPGLQHATGLYSRVAEINHGSIVYLSGLYGDPSLDAEGQIRDIYDQMHGVLEEAGSDFDHLLKATYYISDWNAPRIGLGKLRPQYYKPDRPPTSSLIPVRGTGREGSTLTIDMIGVAPR